MTTSHDRSYIYEGEAFAASKLELYHTKIVILQLYIDDLKSQAKEEVEGLNKQMALGHHDETLKKKLSGAAEKLEKYELLSNKIFKLMNNNSLEHASLKKNIDLEKQSAPHDIASYVAGKEQFKDQIKATDKAMQKNNSDLEHLINENRGILKLPGKGPPSKSQLVHNMKGPEAKQVSNAFERAANISKEMQNKAIQKDAIDISVRYTLNKITLAEIPLKKTLAEQTKKIDELSKMPDKKSEIADLKKLKSVTEKNLKNLEGTRQQLKSLQDQIKQERASKRKILGNELYERLNAATLVAASFHRSEDINNDPNGVKLLAECNFIDNAKKIGISNAEIRAGADLIGQAEKNIHLLQEKIKTGSPGDLQGLACSREIAKLRDGTMNISTSTNTEKCAAANKALAATLTVTNAMLNSKETAKPEGLSERRTGFRR